PGSLSAVGRSVMRSSAIGSSARADGAKLGSVLYTGPFHAALRAAVRERGLTLDRLRSHLAERGIRVGLSSLSDWQHGRSRPLRAGSGRAVAGLEDVLGLPRGSLARLLVQPPRPGGVRPVRRPRDGVD